MSNSSHLDRLFKLTAAGTTPRRELVGGLTTFVTMAYIIAVNPAILMDAVGPDLFGELLFATCVAAASATLIMGLAANYPFALAPGMGLNAFFTYSVVLGMGVHWNLALGVVLAAGILFTILSVLRIREAIINAVPDTLKHATAAGIGLFIAFIGLKNAGIIVASPATLVTLGDLRAAPVWLALLGLIATAVLQARGVKGAILIGVIGVTTVAILAGVAPPPDGVLSLPTWPSHLFAAALPNLAAAFDVALIGTVLAFLFVDLFDTMGTLVGLSQRTGFLDARGRLPRASRALLADSVGTMTGAVLGTSPVTTYIESASGIAAGARTGLASVVVAFCFLLALFLTPLIQSIPVFATAPALVVVGVLMAGSVVKIRWDEISDALPAMLTILVMPLTFSIAHGVVAGIITYPILKRLSGRGHEVHRLIDALALIFIASFIFLD